MENPFQDFHKTSFNTPFSESITSISKIDSMFLTEHLPEKDVTSRKFETLPVEIIERILNYLEPSDLASVGHTNKFLSAMALNQFKRSYRKREIEINIDAMNERVYEPKKVEITSTESIYRILRIFGKQIKKLKISMEYDLEHTQYNVMNAISLHCGDHLKQLKIGRIRRAIRFRKPFEKIVDLTFYECTLPFDKKITGLNKWFPNLRRLNFGNIQFIYEKFKIEHKFNCLEHFGVYTHPYGRMHTDDANVMFTVLLFNPQLRSVGINLISEYDVPIQGTLRSLMPKINTFAVNGRYPFEFSPLPLRKLRKFNLLGCCGVSLPDLIDLKVRLYHLEMDFFVIDEDVVNFVAQCPKLKFLRFIIRSDFNLELFTKMAKSVPTLKEFNIIIRVDRKKIESTALDAAIEFMIHCRQLVKVDILHDADEQEIRKLLQGKQSYVRAEPYLDLFEKVVNEKLPTEASEWRRTHSVRNIELIKGYPLKTPYFGVTFEKQCHSELIGNRGVKASKNMKKTKKCAKIKAERN